jgi:lycopene cyclase domain-containing protein
MTYTVSVVLGALGAGVLDLAVLRTDLLRRKAFWTAYAIVLFFQLVVNGLLTGLKIVRYEGETILGWRVAYAPVEDLLFGFAMVLMTLSVWVYLGRRGAPSMRRATRAARSPRDGSG